MSERVSGVSGRCAGGSAVEGVAHRAGLEELAVGLEEPDREEERLRRTAAQELRAAGAIEWTRGRRCRRRGRSPGRRVDGQVLLADERGPVAGVAQRMHDVAPVVVRAVHPRWASPIMPLTCAHCPVSRHGARARARRRGAERLAEQQALVGQPLDVRRRDLVAVGLDVAARVVRVQVDDVRAAVQVILNPDRLYGECVRTRRLHRLPRLRDPAQRQHPALRDLRATGVAGESARALRGPPPLGPAAPAARVLRRARDPSVLDLLPARRPRRSRAGATWWERASERGRDAERRLGRQAHVGSRRQPARARAASTRGRRRRSRRHVARAVRRRCASCS